jgi:pyruvate,orthophosphate dikinase
VTLLYPLDAEIDRAQRLRLLGTKAAGLHEMTALGIPVPPGFTITTDVGASYRSGGRFPAGLDAAVEAAIERLEKHTGRGFGDSGNPLLVSVRSGAPVSMPGMMDTVLNVGLNDATLDGLAAKHKSEWFALDAYRRLLQMYGTVVRGIREDRFRFRLGDMKTKLGSPRMSDRDIPTDAMRELVHGYLDLIEDASNAAFPHDVETQLWDAIRAVFASWDNARAVRYRRMQGLNDAIGTACTIQAMVFGNAGPGSGSGVAFTRNPSNGEPTLYGEYLENAQGEDVVAGVRTPVPLTAGAAAPGRESESLELTAPETFESIRAHCATLEQHFRDMQDVEFTVENGRPYILQTRSATRTARAAVRIAVDMVGEGLLTEEEALGRVDPRSLEQLLQARLPSEAALLERGVRAASRGLPASPGAASGRIVFDPDDAVRWAAEGQDVILVRQETSAEDVHGMKVARGVITATGGMTSHAAVVARGLGKCCVVGCGGLQVDPHGKRLLLDEAEEALGEGEWLTLDGSSGNVYQGALDFVASPTVEQLSTLMAWADERRRLRIYAEADTPQAARAALSYGAEGVGLCRTEKMFFAPSRLFAMQCALLALDETPRQHWLGELEKAQRDDFIEMFDAMDGRPVTIRLLDRALQEFLPDNPAAFGKIANALDLELDEVTRAVEHHRESNPAFGHRGVRAGLTVPGLYDMQLRAMLGAARHCTERNTPVELEVLVPMVAFASEVAAVRGALERAQQAFFEGPCASFTCRVGTMIELPRACLIAEELARHTDFFSFGGNDLTQTVLGISREDANRFLPAYRNELGLITADPFSELEPRVIEMMRLAIARGRAGRPDLVVGLCGDQGGSPASIDACEALGLDFVSAPLSALPGARLAAAQARIC